jgi:hypothetical protein
MDFETNRFFDSEEYQKAARIREIAKHPGMEALKGLLEEAQRRIGEVALDDKDHSRAWWQGYRRGVGLTIVLLAELTELADVIDEAAERQKREAIGISGGTLLARTLIGGGDI